jgi:hypothetical protein
MELNKKIFFNVLSRIKAYNDILVLQDSPIEGCLDILYALKYGQPSLCINKMTVRLGGSGLDLFDDAPVEKLGKPTPVFLSRMIGALKDAKSCVLDNGCINGIRIEVSPSDTGYSIFSYVSNMWDEFSGKIKASSPVIITLRSPDYEYAVTESAKFVGKDLNRYFMNGICFDFSKDVEYVNIVATDGRKLIVIKYAVTHGKYANDAGQFIIPPAYMHIPQSDYNSVRFHLTENVSSLQIDTKDYHFESLFRGIDGQFPNYLKVIPEVTESTPWFTLCAASFRMTIDSIKSLMEKNQIIYLNAENPQNISISVADGQATQEVEGTASRPMLLSFLWGNLSPCFFDGSVLTKFRLDGSDKAILTHEARLGGGRSLDVTKLFMPIIDGKKHNEKDEFHIPIIKDKLENDSSESSLPSFVNEPEIEPDSEESSQEDEPF